MKELLEQVREFHEAFDVPVLDSPRLPDDERRKLRYRLLAEEFEEYGNAEDEHNLEGIADALGDMAYIIAGTALEYGIPLDRVIDVIHRANMAKLGPDGKPIKRSDGKVIKPEGWQPPNIAAALNPQTYELKESIKVASDPNTTREEYIAKVAKEGYIPTYPDANELQLDLDNELHIAAFQRSFEVLKNNLPVLGLDPNDCKIQMTPSRSGRGIHVRIRLTGFANIDNITRIAFQAALGSDPVRELLSLLRAQKGDKYPSMLIEKEDWKKEI